MLRKSLLTAAAVSALCLSTAAYAADSAPLWGKLRGNHSTKDAAVAAARANGRFAAGSNASRPGAIASNATQSDPSGDATGEPDITQIETNISSGNLVVTVTFANTVQELPAYTAPHGYFDIDTDQNAATGLTGLMRSSAFCGFVIGPDYFIDFFEEEWDDVNNEIALYDADSNYLGDVPVAYSGNTMTITIPLAMIGGDDGEVTIGYLTGDEDGPTDCASLGASVYAASVPALDPRALALLAIALGTAAVLLLRR
jgi:hypothetical protein